jgi:hypothetical protein
MQRYYDHVSDALTEPAVKPGHHVGPGECGRERQSIW